jgi:hypothetical protein
VAFERKKLSSLRSVSYITLVTALLFLVQSHFAFAQVDEGAITGTVMDSSGAVVARAHVTLLNTDVGLTVDTVANANGSYTFSPIRIGHYSVTATAPGFGTTTQQSLTVNVSQTLQVNVQLKAGATSETITVTDAPPALQTEDASVGQVIDSKSVNNLPLNGRNFTFLAQLGAGVNTPQADGRGNASTGAFTANGLRESQNNYLLDGIDNNSNAVDFLNGTNYIVLPPVDAIEEFKVQTADFSAETGRAGGAVLNATIKAGTNSFHGAAWEFLRNDVFDARDWFEANANKPRGELRQNQFGASGGGPILKNKVFFFGDYEGFRKTQGNPQTGSVPTAQEITSGYTDLSQIVSGQLGPGTARTDDLGRIMPAGTISDPATTRLVKAGAVDPVSGFQNKGTSDVYVRDPFSLTCGPAKSDYTNCTDLNQLPAARLDPNAINVLKLFPAPNNGVGYNNNFISQSKISDKRNAFDVRVDMNALKNDQIFARFSYVDDPQFFPGIFGGTADGGGFAQGLQTAKSSQSAGNWTHDFSPTTVNVAKIGFNHLHTTRFGPDGAVDGIPSQYNIQGIPQGNENGGLPTITVGGLSQLGSSNFLPSDEISQTLQLTDDFTKIYGNHSFKMGIEIQNVKFSTLQPGWSRGQFDYDGRYVDIPALGGGKNNGMGQFLIPAGPATDPNGVNYSGGSDEVRASNINKTYDERQYIAGYVQDDWKVTPKLTLNLGLRYDYFSPIKETNGGQANFAPNGLPNGAPTFLIPATGKDNRTISTFNSTNGLTTNFTDQLAADGIKIEFTDRYGQGLVKTKPVNIGPRVGFAYQVTPRLVTRGGFGYSYNSFENQGYGPNIGENYPFVFNLDYTAHGGNGNVVPVSQNTPFAACPSAGNGGTASLFTAFSCIPLDPAKVDASGLNLLGMQFDYKTPQTLSANYTLQYSITHTTAIQAAWVLTHVNNLQMNLSSNNVSQILPQGADTTNLVPFPHLGNGGYAESIGKSTYNGLQVTMQQQAWKGLNFLATYTWSKTLTDAGDLLNGGSVGGIRALQVPGLGVPFDYALASFDIRNVFHFSGGYELPFGKGKMFLGNANRLTNSILGGWSANYILVVQQGQPQTFGCNTGTTSGTGCNDVRVKGQSPKLGITHQSDNKGRPRWYNNAAAFNQPCRLGGTNDNPTPIPDSPSGCIPLTGSGALGGKTDTATGPGYKKLDFSLFKSFPITERYSFQFRADVFDLFNHPNFSAPDNTDIHNTQFGDIGSTRDAPYGSRQIQFALKFYY